MTIEDELAGVVARLDQHFHVWQSALIAWLHAQGVTNPDDMREALTLAYDEYERQRGAALEELRPLVEECHRLRQRHAELQARIAS